jgi:hypothetical protein
MTTYLFTDEVLPNADASVSTRLYDGGSLEAAMTTDLQTEILRRQNLFIYFLLMYTFYFLLYSLIYAFINYFCSVIRSRRT